MTYRLMDQLRAAPPAAPTRPASNPSNPYSTRSTVPTTRELAPRVLRMAASYTRRYFVIATAPTRMSTPVKSTSPPTAEIPSVTFATTFRTVSSSSRISMTDTFGKRRDEVALHPGACLQVGGAANRRDEAVRRGFEHAGPEDEHESAGATVAPVHLTDARHAGDNRLPQHVEPHVVADVDLEALAGYPLRSKSPACSTAWRPRTGRPRCVRWLQSKDGRSRCTRARVSRARAPPRDSPA